MDVKFLKDLQDLCVIADLPNEVQILQDIMNDGLVYSTKIVRPKPEDLNRERNIKVSFECEILKEAQNF